jgi:pyruvate/2-oxoglutarate dehydrogenase complex dihydrolipoamide acyltransferase (E2) component
MPDTPETEVLPYLLPDLGEGMAEAELVRWRVEVGDHVTRDQIVVHVQTDKAEVELPVPASGTIVRLGAEVGDLVPVGGTLLELLPDAGTALGGTPVRGSTTTDVLAPLDRNMHGSAAPKPKGSVRPLAAPPTRKLARELGVDLATVAGSGPGGRITTADVRAAVAASPAAPGPGDDARDRREPLRGVRRAMARNLADAWREVPHISLFDELDARPLLAAHADLRAGDDGITLTAWFVRAAVVAIEAFPIMNASLDTSSPDGRDEIVFHGAVHMGVAVASDDGLVVPVVHDAHERDVVDVGHEIVQVTEAGRAGHLPAEMLRGATFTVTNFGTEGGRFATPIVRPPQVAILGFGAVRTRPLVDGGAVIAAPTLPVSLSADHRVVDGRDATGFLERVLALLRDPAVGIAPFGR